MSIAAAAGFLHEISGGGLGSNTENRWGIDWIGRGRGEKEGWIESKVVGLTETHGRIAIRLEELGLRSTSTPTRKFEPWRRRRAWVSGGDSLAKRKVRFTPLIFTVPNFNLVQFSPVNMKPVRNAHRLGFVYGLFLGWEGKLPATSESWKFLNGPFTS
jgi:hypothetical protein